MTVGTIAPPRTAAGRRVLPAMWGGLALTVVATVYPFIDRSTTHVLADHLRATYPSYGAARVEEGVTAYLVMLSIIGGLGVLSWLGIMWATRVGKRWTSWAATGVFVFAACLALAGLTVKDTSGYVGLAPALAWLQVPPCLLGLVSVVQLWRRPQ